MDNISYVPFMDSSYGNKLHSLQRPLHALVEESSDRVAHMKLLLWYYEDQLKTKFAKFLSIVKVLEQFL